MKRQIQVNIANNKTKKHKIFRIFIIILIVFFIAFIADGIYCNTNIQITNYEIISNNLPTEFKGYKIAQISDLHNAEFGKDNENLINLLKENKPDMIVITGDMVDSLKTNIEIAINFGKRASKIAPCYYTAGNHEASLKNYFDLENGLVDSGVQILNDKAIEITKDSQTIKLIGIIDPQFKGGNNSTEQNSNFVSETLKKLDYQKDDFTILLSHRPELISSYSNSNIDLILSGHAHGGQIRLPFFGGIVAPGQGLFPQYDAGIFNLNDTKLIVSRGLGNSILPLRILNRAELVIVTLK